MPQQGAIGLAISLRTFSRVASSASFNARVINPLSWPVHHPGRVGLRRIGQKIEGQAVFGVVGAIFQRQPSRSRE
jgi:hypothetical protein